MSKGFGIAALIVALIALVVPFVGVVVSALAVILAIVAAFSGDRVFATAVSIIVFVDTFVLSPSTWVLITQPGGAGSLIEIFLVILCGAPLAVVALLALLNRPDGRPAVPSPAISPVIAPVQSPPPRADVEVPIEKPTRESFAFGSAIEETQTAQPTIQINPPQTRRSDLSSKPTMLVSVQKWTHRVTDSINVSAAQTMRNMAKDNSRRALLYILYGALPVIAILFIPETRTFAFSSAIDFADFLSQHRTVAIQSIVLLALAEIFLVVGRRSGIAGVVVCLLVVGILWWREYVEIITQSIGQESSQADADLVQSVLKNVHKPYELPPLQAAPDPQ
jgi:hypothetical protein